MHYCRIAFLFLTSLALLGPIRSAPTSGLGESVSFVSFQDFLRGVKSTSFNTLGKRAVQNEGAFEEMRSHILKMYAGVTMHTNVVSFVSEGQHVDCIAITEQPSVFHLGIKEIEKPPKDLTPPAGGHALPSGFSHSSSLLSLGLKDQFGNAVSCPKHAIPMSRLTMDRLTQFPTLSHFFAKHPHWQASTSSTDGTSLHQRGTQAKPALDPVRKFAGGGQTVINYGGNAWMDLWTPVGDYSTSHQRYTAASQALEGGWAVYPQHFQTTLGVTYIYWSNGTHGCYNLDCPGFVQTNNAWYLGGTWYNYSTVQKHWGFRLQWKLIRGNWWFFLEGSGDYSPVGYLPAATIYGSSQMSRYATHLEFGGEVGRFPGDHWPQMGSGAMPAAAPLAVASQWLIYYDPHNQNGGVGVVPTLSPRPSPPCYAVQIIRNSTANGGTFVQYGGEGGDMC